MTATEKIAFDEANKKVHPVETQWHYDILMKYGYVAETKEAIGFVRSYTYRHPKSGIEITCTTGTSADYWNSSSGKHGFWATLENFLKG